MASLVVYGGRRALRWRDSIRSRNEMARYESASLRADTPVTTSICCVVAHNTTQPRTAVNVNVVVLERQRRIEMLTK